MDQPTVVLMCGIAGAGKTSYAQRLAAAGYERLSIDEEIWRHFGRYGIDYPPEDYPRHSAAADLLLRQRLVELIHNGRDVVVDASFWQRARRADYRALIEETGGRQRLIYLKVGVETLRQRLAERSSRFDANAAFPISDELLESYLAGFEEPDGEGEEVIVVP